MVGRNIVTQPPLVVGGVVCRRIVALINGYLRKGVAEDLVNCVVRAPWGLGHSDESV